jgi:hypothetical protein
MRWCVCVCVCVCALLTSERPRAPFAQSLHASRPIVSVLATASTPLHRVAPNRGPTRISVVAFNAG